MTAENIKDLDIKVIEFLKAEKKPYSYYELCGIFLTDLLEKPKTGNKITSFLISITNKFLPILFSGLLINLVKRGILGSFKEDDDFYFYFLKVEQDNNRDSYFI